MYVVFSIGNPLMMRHSAGHMALSHVIRAYGAKQLTKKSVYSATAVEDVIFVKSNCYMNESDKALTKFFSDYKINPHTVTVVILYDDFESPIGKITVGPFKKNESHNGLRAVSRVVDATKIGVGIGPKPVNASKDQMASWVLSRFTQDERVRVEQLLAVVELKLRHITDE